MFGGLSEQVVGGVEQPLRPFVHDDVGQVASIGAGLQGLSQQRLEGGPVACRLGDRLSLRDQCAGAVVAAARSGDFSRRGLDPELAPLYAQALVGSVSMTAQWWLDAREPKKEVVAAHLVNLMWNGLTGLEPDPGLQGE